MSDSPLREDGMPSERYDQHRHTVDVYLGGEPCTLDIDTEWPYECEAKDRLEGTVSVIVCRKHLAWWTEERIKGKKRGSPGMDSHSMD